MPLLAQYGLYHAHISREGWFSTIPTIMMKVEGADDKRVIEAVQTGLERISDRNLINEIVGKYDKFLRREEIDIRVEQPTVQLLASRILNAEMIDAPLDLIGPGESSIS